MGDATAIERLTTLWGVKLAVGAHGARATPEHVRGDFVIKGREDEGTCTAADFAMACVTAVRRTEPEHSSATDEEIAQALLDRYDVREEPTA